MDLKITERIEESLLSRAKIISKISFEAATPSEKEVKSKIASSLNADENLVVVKHIYTDFGFKRADVSAYLYKDEKEMENIEIKPKKKDEAKETKPKEEKPQAKEEKPKESKEEKLKAEEKPKEKAEK